MIHCVFKIRESARFTAEIHNQCATEDEIRQDSIHLLKTYSLPPPMLSIHAFLAPQRILGLLTVVSRCCDLSVNSMTT